ncbi:hypothetical protein RCJ22_12875 [Vibrio sp. FNV 38]|nr:hypothetical protein [Vibrio sp. FNV 38]
MKKLLMITTLLGGLASALGGYYLFYIKDADLNVPPEAPLQEVVEEVIEELQVELETVPLAPQIKQYYVAKPRIGIREVRELDGYFERELFHGDKVVVLEELEGWGRISSYFVYQEGGEEVAEWVLMSDVQEAPPEISQEERYAILGDSLEGSDDYLLYQDLLIQYADQLIEEKICDLLDFEQSNGWMRSINYADRQVYFVYCGGLRPVDKVYLDVLNGNIFYP